MKATLREILKPPFKWDSKDAIKLNEIFRLEMFINNIHTPSDDVKMVIDWITAALNEKWQRDFGGEDES